MTIIVMDDIVTWKMDGGVLNQQLIHHLDCMINIVSEIIEINSFSSTLVNNLSVKIRFQHRLNLKMEHWVR